MQNDATTASDREALRDEVGRKLARLVEITRVIDRNTDDKSFVRSDPAEAEIVYVFDTNAIRMFFEPFQNPEYAELFHASVWGDQYGYYDRINEQACVLISEYILSGVVDLPGQRDQALYMSTWHHHELLDQMGKIRDGLREHAEHIEHRPAFSRDAARPMLELTMLKKLDPEKNRDQFIEYAASQAAPRDAGEVRAELRQLSLEEFKDRVPLIRLRRFCSLLAQDRILEPLHQLKRFRTRHIAGRFRPIEQKFRANAEEAQRISADARDWQASLSKAMSDRPMSARPAKALGNDAKTLAHLIWAQKNKVQGNQRIVLVTGDKLLYDVYRRRHSEMGELPFLLRPLTQFAPLFNPSDAASSVPDTEATFKQVRSEIEMATVSLNLNLFGKDNKDAKSLVRARDHFILDCEKSITSAEWAFKSLYPQLFDHTWLTSENKKFDELVEPLQDIERLMLGVFPNLIAPRIEVDRKTFVDAAKQGNNRAFATLFRKEIDDVSSKAFDVSIPFMCPIVQRLLSTIRERERQSLVPRAALAVRLRFDISSSPEQSSGEVIQTLLGKKDKQLDEALNELGRNPSRIFALAALLTFYLEQWDEAARYAELAANASEAANRKGASSDDKGPSDGGRADNDGLTPAGEDEHYEYLYLQAASLRFRLAAFTPDPRELFHDPLALWRANACAALTACLEWHGRKDQVSRWLRTLSERAAVNLSYCAWFAFGQLGDIRVNRGHDRVVDLMQAAVDDLAACHDLSPRAEERVHQLRSPRGKKASQEIISAGTRQYRINSVAARYIAAALQKKNLITNEQFEEMLVRLPTDAVIDPTKRPPISRAYLHTLGGNLEELHAIGVGSLSLALDRAIIDGLKKLYPLRGASGTVS